MNLLDVLACPRCRGDLVRAAADLRCVACGRVYAVEDGVPILLPTTDPVEIVHEAELTTWDGYVSVIQQLIDCLGPDAVVLDLGAGNRDVADERIIRVDVMRSPHVDVVADAHALPFKSDVVTFLHASAVWEHLKRPWIASAEVVRVLRPGGHAFVDCNFVYPFHGYPAVYFNASVEGLRTLFEDLVEVCAGVAPWQMPSFALEGLVSRYLEYFRVESETALRFTHKLQDLDDFPIRDFDQCFSQEDACKIAAAVFVFGHKETGDGLGIVPGAVGRAWREDEELQRRYPNPCALLSDMRPTQIDCLLRWARTEGREKDPAIAACFDDVEPFTRRVAW